MKKIIFLSVFVIVLLSAFSFNIGIKRTAAADEAAVVGDTTKTDNTVSLPNPITGKTDKTSAPPDINLIIGNAIKGALGLVGSIALVMFIYGGFTWMLAAGSPQRVTKGKDILVWATIGLVVIFSAYGLVDFIFEQVLKPLAK